jgi:hypothetical protein
MSRDRVPGYDPGTHVEVDVPLVAQAAGQQPGDHDSGDALRDQEPHEDEELDPTPPRPARPAPAKAGRRITSGSPADRQADRDQLADRPRRATSPSRLCY